MTRKSIRFAIACVTLIACAVPVRGQSLSGTLDATLTLETACAISGTTLTSGIDLGTLAFGTWPATFTGQLTAQATGGPGGAGNTTVVCSPDVSSIQITIDGGGNAGQGSSIGTGARALASSGKFMPYDVFSDSGHTTAYPINTGVSVNVSGSGAAFDLPIYGLVNKTTANAVDAGAYTDTLQVTIEW